MADTTTPNYSWVKPEVGGSPTTWGAKLNSDLDLIDAKCFEIATDLANAIAATGGGPSPSTTPPIMDGAASAGASTDYSRGDHVHPSDTTKVSQGGTPVFATLTVNGATTVTNGVLSINSASGIDRQLFGKTNGVARWGLTMANSIAETGSNTGSNWSLNAFTDAGAFLSSPLTVQRATAVCIFSQAIVNGPSDRTLKENIEPLQGSLDKVRTLQGVSFNWIGKTDPQIGLIAQDVRPIVPEIIQEFGDGKLALDYPKLTALLIEAVKELSAEIAALKARLA